MQHPFIRAQSDPGFQHKTSFSHLSQLLSPQTLHLHHRASGGLLKSLCVQQKDQELLKCSISRAVWEKSSRQEPWH